jgi:hypothetical protein
MGQRANAPAKRQRRGWWAVIKTGAGRRLAMLLHTGIRMQEKLPSNPDALQLLTSPTYRRRPERSLSPNYRLALHQKEESPCSFGLLPFFLCS